jgi:uncharacterized repeat protein (TIGR03843 family)
VIVDALRLLRHGEIEVDGRMPWSSNATFLVTASGDGHEAKAIYKPVRGERPLWDFPSGLHRREVAAWQLSEYLGWHLVPPTIIREGPFGEGSLQLFVAADFEQHYFTLYEGRADLHDALRRMCAFDVLANNTDRKSGHCLLGLDGRIYGIDHGLCFAEDFKLRTVIWEFGGERVPDDVLQDVGRVADCVPLEVATLLDDEEVAALQRRAAKLVDRGSFPIDTSGHRYPWPLV